MLICDWSSDLCSSGLGRAFLDPLHDGRISLGAAGRNELNGSHLIRLVDGEPAARPAPERFTHQMRLLDALCIHVAQNMLAIFIDLVRLVRLVGISLAQCADRSEEHTSQLKSLMTTTYADFCSKK